jgi:hypothetical protein
MKGDIMKRRLALSALALLLTAAALVGGSRPAQACFLHPACVTQGCFGVCGAGGGICNTCTGNCLCTA